MSARVFDERLLRSEKHDRLIEGLATPHWRIALAALYLSTGRCLPDEAKRQGCYFGYCDAEGNLAPKAEATHVGWMVAPVEHTCP